MLLETFCAYLLIRRQTVDLKTSFQLQVCVVMGEQKHRTATMQTNQRANRQQPIV